MFFPNITLVFPDTTLFFPDTTLFFPDTTLFFPNTTLLFPNTTLLFPNTTLPFPNTTLPFPNTTLPFPIFHMFLNTIQITQNILNQLKVAIKPEKNILMKMLRIDMLNLLRKMLIEMRDWLYHLL